MNYGSLFLFLVSFWSEGTQLCLHVLLQFVWWPMNLSESYNWEPNDHVDSNSSMIAQSISLRSLMFEYFEPSNALCRFHFLLCSWSCDWINYAWLKYVCYWTLWFLFILFSSSYDPWLTFNCQFNMVIGKSNISSDSFDLICTYACPLLFVMSNIW